MKKFEQRMSGQGLEEYALILALVAVVVLVILALVGPSIGAVFSNILEDSNFERYQVATYCSDSGNCVTLEEKITDTDKVCRDDLVFEDEVYTLTPAGCVIKSK